MMKHPNKKIMQQAIDYARKHYTVGAIIVKGNKVLVKCGGYVAKKHDAIGHSETNAISKACRKLKNEELKGCWLYTVCEPCPMCTSAAIWARMEGIVYGATMEDQREVWNQRSFIKARDMIKQEKSRIKLIEEFMRKECKDAIIEFFK